MPEERDRASLASPAASPAVSPTVPPAGRRAHGPGHDGLRRFRAFAGALLLVQLVVLLAYSTYLFHRFDLTDDFGTYTQAWWLIGHGHLNPVDTIQTPTYPFLESHFELALWPLGWLGRLFPTPALLLWLQDAAIVLTEAVVLLWVGRLTAGRVGRWREAVGVVAALALVGNVAWYETASFDVHAETLGLPFVVLAAYGLWHQRPVLTAVAAVVAVAFGDVLAVAVFCVGVAALLSARTRRDGGWRGALGLVAFAAAWVVLVTALGDNRGSGLVTNYGYLVHGGPHASSVSVAAGLAAHPFHLAHVAAARWRAMGRVLASAGLLGVLTPLGLLLSLGTLVPAALNANAAFLSPTIAFQTLAVVPFVFLGTVLVLVRIGTRRPTGRGGRTRGAPRWRPWAAWGLAAALLALAVAQGLTLYGHLRSDWWRVDAPAAAALGDALARTPAGAEVIASQGVIGRFATRTDVYPYLAAPQTFPVRRPVVDVVVAPAQGIEPVPPSTAAAAVAYLRRQLHARVVVDRGGVTVLEWRPPPGTRSIVLP